MNQHLMYITYSQISVFESNLSNPFNSWSSKHIDQGFSWRPGSVSFSTLVNSGDVLVSFKVESQHILAPTTERAISVPFDIDNNTVFEVATITESFSITIEQGSHELIYETGWNGESLWILFTLIKGKAGKAQILMHDDSLGDISEFIMSSEPA